MKKITWITGTFMAAAFLVSCSSEHFLEARGEYAGNVTLAGNDIGSGTVSLTGEDDSDMSLSVSSSWYSANLSKVQLTQKDDTVMVDFQNMATTVHGTVINNEMHITFYDNGDTVVFEGSRQ